jgi:hypothetical protein
MRRIGEEREGELELLGEGPVRGGFVGGHARDGDARLLEFLPEVAEAAAFLGSAGGVGGGIEPEEEVLPGEVAQGDVLPGRVLEREVRRLLAFLRALTSCPGP